MVTTIPADMMELLIVTPPVVMEMNLPLSVAATTYADVWLLSGSERRLPWVSETDAKVTSLEVLTACPIEIVMAAEPL